MGSPDGTDRSKRFEPMELIGQENSLYSPRDGTNTINVTADNSRTQNTSVTHKRGNRYAALHAEMINQKRIEETEANTLTQRQEALLARKR
jgi:hypothetical protein